MQVTRAAWRAIEQAGRAVYEEMARQQQRQLQREMDKQSYAFEARRKAINRVGLPNVRQYRLARLAEEEAAWQQEAARRAGATPEVNLILLLQASGGDGA